MAICLNTGSANKNFSMLAHDKYFVDKTHIIEIINARINTPNRYICITKPRRFGKTSVLNMLGTYYCRAYDAKELFDHLKIHHSSTYPTHLNQYNVINLCLNNLPDAGSTYEDYISLIRESIADDIKEAYPELKNRKFRTISELLDATGDQFIFIIDEWDYIFSHELFPEHHSAFLEFLRNLLKDRPYVALAYMTGVLPIKKYSTGSALNMFKEYTMLRDPFFEEYFGFTENEVKALCERQSALTMDEISDWYNGYQAGGGTRLYNPRSVVCALEDSMCQSYWTRTGKMDEVLFFLKYNIGEVRDDVIRLVNDIPVRIDIKKEYYAGQKSPANRKDIYSAMIIYGLLSYHDGELRIPNKELMLEFEEALEDDDFGYVAELVRNSDQILNATLEKKGDTVASYLHDIHNSELPILKYNDENSLSCVVTLAYLSARNKYRIEREEKSGKGFADFIFHPRRNNLPGIILELKADSTPQDAIAQIKNKEYCEKLRKENVTNILAVGLSYDTGKKEHLCTITDLS
ncbi:AAA family ATPase [Acetatifactor aquisgranensis]|uniref:AAA family ATPase n=1 Tax=Acetatifactor aquisgranensis TaxID=2941233 RepID=UPI0020415BB3|nr:AAA family ATPase [Acetatifactor aquisgranensis]